MRMTLHIELEKKDHRLLNDSPKHFLQSLADALADHDVDTEIDNETVIANGLRPRQALRLCRAVVVGLSVARKSERKKGRGGRGPMVSAVRSLFRGKKNRPKKSK